MRVFIHVPRTGGLSVHEACLDNNVDIQRLHCCDAKYLGLNANTTVIKMGRDDIERFKDSSFVISLRNPIDRFVSTFNFLIQERVMLLKVRSLEVYKKLVLKDSKLTEEENIVEYLKNPEYELWPDNPDNIDLSKYDYDVNKFAENLYDSNGILNPGILKAPENIKTIYEDLHYYYDKIINEYRSNIEGVLCFPTLEEDAKRIFNIDIPHINKSFANNQISQLAYTNLTKFLESDFTILKKMLNLDVITEKQYSDLQVCKSYTNVTRLLNARYRTPKEETVTHRMPLACYRNEASLSSNYVNDDIGDWDYTSFNNILHRNLHGTLRFVANVYETRLSIKTLTHRFIHIGKCGGTSIRAALVSKLFLKHPTGYISERDYNLTRFVAPLYMEWFHCDRVHTRSNLSHYVCLRNPIDRFVSAFNWIYYRVSTPTYEPNLHKEYVERNPTVEDFALYDNDVNNMAEQLYDDDGVLNEKAHSIIMGPPGDDLGNFRGNQLSWNITYYMEELVNSSTTKFAGVIAFPTLNEDAKHHFGIELRHFKKNKVGNKTLSKLGYKNLRRYLDSDFRCIKAIYDQGGMTEKQFNDLNVCYSAPP